MDARSLFVVVVKLYGLWLLVQIVEGIPVLIFAYASLTPDRFPVTLPGSTGAFPIINVVFKAVVGSYLVFRTQRLANIVGL